MDESSAVFLLAVTAYLLLGVSVVLHARGTPSRILSMITALVVLIHVAGVWNTRYGWSLEKAIERGYTAPIVFHAALFVIVLAAFVPRPWWAWLHMAGFAAVSLGATAAVFTYESVAVFRIPVLAIGIGTVVASLIVWRRRPRPRLS